MLARTTAFAGAREREETAQDECSPEKTSTRRVPWHLIPANNKPYGRLAALRIIADRLSKGVSLEPRPLDPAVASAAADLLGIRLPVADHAGA